MWSLISALATLGFVAGVVGLSILIGVDPQIYHLERTAPSFILGLVVAGIVGAIIEQIRGGCK